MSSLHLPLLLALASLAACNDGITVPSRSGGSAFADRINISPNPATLVVGETMALSVEGVSASDVVWSSESPEIASVSAGGFVRAIATGRSTISAREGSRTGSVEVIVWTRRNHPD